MAEAVTRSPETTVWRSAEQYSLPPLLSLLGRINKSQEKLEADLTKAFKTLQSTFEYAVVLTAQKEQNFHFDWQQAGFSTDFSGDPEGQIEREKYSRTLGDGIKINSEAIPEMERALALALESISSFFSQEMEEAKEILSFESLTRGRYLQPSCAKFTRSIQALRAQVNTISSQSFPYSILTVTDLAHIYSCSQYFTYNFQKCFVPLKKCFHKHTHPFLHILFCSHKFFTAPVYSL